MNEAIKILKKIYENDMKEIKKDFEQQKKKYNNFIDFESYVRDTLENYHSYYLKFFMKMYKIYDPNERELYFKKNNPYKKLKNSYNFIDFETCQELLKDVKILREVFGDLKSENSYSFIFYMNDVREEMKEKKL